MPVGLYTGPNTHTANGVTTVFAYDFKILQSADLKVTVGGVVTTTGFTVSGVGASGGGDITFTTAPAADAEIVLSRNRAYSRSVDYQRNGSFDEETVDADFDAVVMLIQQLNAGVKRAMKSPESVSADQVISDDDWVARAGKFPVYDAGGNLTLSVGTAGADSALRTDLAASGGSALVSFLQAGTGAVSRTAQSKLRESCSVKDFGAAGDGVTDDTAAIQAAIDAVKAAGGGVVYFPAGRYMSGPLTCVTGGSDIEATARVRFLGAGMNNTFIEYNVADAGTLLSLNGSYQEISEITLTGQYGTANGRGLYITACGRCLLSNVEVRKFELGIELEDVITGIFTPVIEYCGRGLYAHYSSISTPNAMTFIGAAIDNNNTYGAKFLYPNSVVFLGGDIESNGLTAGAAGAGVIVDLNTTSVVDGGMPIQFNGVYFEGNGESAASPGLADVCFSLGASMVDCSALFIGCFFGRDDRITNCINTAFGAFANKFQITLIGNCFGGLFGYIPSAARPYLAKSGSGIYNVWDYGNIWNAPNEMVASTTSISAALAADVPITDTANYFTGPSVAQGTDGTWDVTGTVTLHDTAGAANFAVLLWDGTTAIASAYVTTNAANNKESVTLSGIIRFPAGNLRMSVKDLTAGSGVILYNASGSQKDSNIAAKRIP